MFVSGICQPFWSKVSVRDLMFLEEWSYVITLLCVGDRASGLGRAG